MHPAFQMTLILAGLLVFSGEPAGAARSDPEAIQAVYLAQSGILTAEQKKSFEELSPEEQERIRKNYQKFKDLPDPKKDALRERYRKWQELPPETKEELRKELRQQQKKDKKK